MSDDPFFGTETTNSTTTTTQDDLFGDDDQLLGISSNPQPQNDDNSLFDQPANTDNQVTDLGFGSAPASGGDQMLAGDDDDEELYQQAPAPAAAAEPTPISKWNEEKQAQIAIQDQKEREDMENLKNQSSSDLQAFNNKVDELQKKRAVQNKELDEQFIRSQEDETIQPWERVVNQIDFNRTDLHEKDVSKMKTLLLQLKNQ